LLSSEPTTRVLAAEATDLPAQVGRLLMSFLDHIHSGTSGSWLDLTLTMPQLKMLLIVDRLGPASMSQVAGRLRIGVSAATGLIDRLVEHGLIQRVPDLHDRRVVRVTTTEDGHNLVVRLGSAGSEQIRAVLEHLTADDLERCVSVLTAMNEAAEAEFKAKQLYPVAVAAAGRVEGGR
jgi:DNA-binding MarR family transcriptional regulator